MAKKSTLYNYTIVWHPSESQSEKGEKSQMLIEPKYLLAPDQNSAFMQAARQIPEKYLEELDQVDILIRPF